MKSKLTMKIEGGKSFSAVQIDAKPDEGRFIYRFATARAATTGAGSPE